jgi:hypothetical protein
MIAAVINGSVGVILTIILGTEVLHLNFNDLILCLAASNLAALISVLTTLHAEKVLWIRQRWLNRSAKTWALLVSLYFGILLAASPSLRNIQSLIYLALPLILSTGFAILVFGPIQDFIVRRQQRK